MAFKFEQFLWLEHILTGGATASGLPAVVEAERVLQRLERKDKTYRCAPTILAVRFSLRAVLDKDPDIVTDTDLRSAVRHVLDTKELVQHPDNEDWWDFMSVDPQEMWTAQGSSKGRTDDMMLGKAYTSLFPSVIRQLCQTSSDMKTVSWQQVTEAVDATLELTPRQQQDPVLVDRRMILGVDWKGYSGKLGFADDLAKGYKLQAQASQILRALEQTISDAGFQDLHNEGERGTVRLQLVALKDWAKRVVDLLPPDSIKYAEKLQQDWVKIAPQYFEYSNPSPTEIQNQLAARARGRARTGPSKAAGQRSPAAMERRQPSGSAGAGLGSQRVQQQEEEEEEEEEEEGVVSEQEGVTQSDSSEPEDLPQPARGEKVKQRAHALLARGGEIRARVPKGQLRPVSPVLLPAAGKDGTRQGQVLARQARVPEPEVVLLSDSDEPTEPGSGRRSLPARRAAVRAQQAAHRQLRGSSDSEPEGAHAGVEAVGRDRDVQRKSVGDLPQMRGGRVPGGSPEHERKGAAKRKSSAPVSRSERQQRMAGQPGGVWRERGDGTLSGGKEFSEGEEEPEEGAGKVAAAGKKKRRLSRDDPSVDEEELYLEEEEAQQQRERQRFGSGRAAPPRRPAPLVHRPAKHQDREPSASEDSFALDVPYQLRLLQGIAKRPRVEWKTRDTQRLLRLFFQQQDLHPGASQKDLVMLAIEADAKEAEPRLQHLREEQVIDKIKNLKAKNKLIRPAEGF